MSEVLDRDGFVAVIAVLFLILLFSIVIYIIFKDRDGLRKFAQIEKSIEDINKEVYKIQKWILEFGKSDSKDFQEVLDKCSSLASDLDDLRGVVQADREHLEDRMILFEEKIRDVGHFSLQGGDSSDKKVVEMFQNGFSMDMIAKELRMGRGEIEFILKLSGVK